MLHYKEYDTDGTTVVYSKDATYDAAGNDTDDVVTTKRSDGSIWVFTTHNDFKAWNGTAWNGQYWGGSVTHSATTVTKGGVHQADQDSDSQYNYQWFDAPGESWESYTSNNNTYYSTLYYDQRQDLTEANIHDGQERDIYYKENIDGRIVQRDTVTNSNAPHARYYYHGDIQVGDVSGLRCAVAQLRPGKPTTAPAT